MAPIRYRTTAFTLHWSFALALLAALAACLPFNQPTPTITPSLTPDIRHLDTPFSTLTPDIQHPGTPLLFDTPFPNTPSLPCASPGQIASGIVNSDLLAKPMTYRVYLPPCYLDQAETHYPTLYLLHGQTYTEDQWLRLGVPPVMDRLIAAGEIPPFIIVFPYDYSYLQPTQYRFEDVFIQALIPQIDSAYRTLPDVAHRAIGGLSRGAAWALHLGIRHPELFGAIGAHSPAIFYSDTASLPLYLRDIPPDERQRLHIDIGDADKELENTLAFKNFLDKYSIPYEWHIYIGFHDEAYWAAHVESYLRWYAEGWAKSDDHPDP